MALAIMARGSDVGELSTDGPDNVVGFDVVGAHVENLLSSEPANSCINNVSSRHDPSSSNGSDVHPNDHYFDELGDHDGDEE